MAAEKMAAKKVGNSLQEKKEPEPDNLNGADGSEEQLPGSVEEAERRAVDPFAGSADPDSAELKAQNYVLILGVVD